MDTCEIAWSNGDVSATISRDSTLQREGTYSFKALAANTNTGRIAYRATGTLNLSSYKGIELYFYPRQAMSQGQISLVLYSGSGGTGVLDTIPLPSDLLVANRWYCLFFPFASPSSLTGVASVGFNNSTGVAWTGFNADYLVACSAVNVPVLWVRGLDDLDDLRGWPGIDQTDLVGSRRQVINSTARNIQVQTAPVLSKADRAWIASTFNLANDKSILYSAEDLPVVWKDAKNPLKSTWAANAEAARQYLLEFDEKTTWTTAPLSMTT